MLKAALKAFSLVIGYWYGTYHYCRKYYNRGEWAAVRAQLWIAVYRFPSFVWRRGQYPQDEL